MRELYQVWPSILSDEQVDRIVELALSRQAEEATIFSAADDLQGIRSATVRWLEDAWIRTLLFSTVADVSYPFLELTGHR